MKTSSLLLLGLLLAFSPAVVAQERGRDEKLDLTDKVLIVILQDRSAPNLQDTAVRTIGGRAFLMGKPVNLNSPGKEKENEDSVVLFPVDRIQEITLFKTLEALQAKYRPSPDYELFRAKAQVERLDEEISRSREYLARSKIEVAKLEELVAKGGESPGKAAYERLLESTRSDFDSVKKKFEQLVSQKAQVEKELAKLRATTEKQQSPKK